MTAYNKINGAYAGGNDELLNDVLKKAWTSPGPFDHDGAYYRVRGATSTVRCLQRPHIPVYFGGSSGNGLLPNNPSVALSPSSNFCTKCTNQGC